jgi:hypothetical protein
MPGKHGAEQAAINKHRSQPIGADAFDGQHGILFAIAAIAVAAGAFIAAMSDIDMSGIAMSDIEASDAEISDIETFGIAPVIMGRDIGADTRPAIIKTASSQRRVIWRMVIGPFTPHGLTTPPQLIACRN